MKQTKHSIAIIFLLLFTAVASAQEKITLEAAIMKALENNYSLKITRNDLSIAENNVTLAPFLPTLSGSSRQSQTDNTLTTETFAPETNRTNQYGAGLSFSWKMFDGLGMFATYGRSKELLAMSSQRVKIDVENLVTRVCTEY